MNLIIESLQPLRLSPIIELDDIREELWEKNVIFTELTKV